MFLLALGSDWWPKWCLMWCCECYEAKNLLQQLLTGVQHSGWAMDLSRREVQLGTGRTSTASIGSYWCLQGKNIVITLSLAIIGSRFELMIDCIGCQHAWWKGHNKPYPSLSCRWLIRNSYGPVPSLPNMGDPVPSNRFDRWRFVLPRLGDWPRLTVSSWPWWYLGQQVSVTHVTSCYMFIMFLLLAQMLNKV